MSDTQITGRYRYRADSEGHIILQVEERCTRTGYGAEIEWIKLWRDATVEDITLNIVSYPIPDTSAPMLELDWAKEV